MRRFLAHPSILTSLAFGRPCAQARAGHVAKVAFYQDERMVEVLDTNGLQRSVQIFPEATPYLIEDLRAGKASFYVAPQDSSSDFTTFMVAFATAFVSTMLVVQVLSALGMLWMVVFALAVMGEELTRFAVAVGEGWELTVSEWRAALVAYLGGPAEREQPESLPIYIDDDDSGLHS